MVYCYDYTINERKIFNNAKEAAKILNISPRSVWRGIQNTWLVDNNYLFDTEELPDLEIETKRPLSYYVLDVKSNKVFEFKRLNQAINFLSDYYNISIRQDVVCRAAKRHWLCLERFFISRKNDFSFIKYHRHHKKIKQISNDKITA